MNFSRKVTMAIECVFIAMLVLVFLYGFSFVGSASDQITEDKRTIEVLRAENSYLNKELNSGEVFPIREAAEYIQRVNPTVTWGTAMTIVLAMVDASNEYGIPVPVLLALAEIRTTFYHMAVSHANAKGLIQIHIPTWEASLKEKGLISDVNDLFQPHKNIMAGGYILKKYYDRALRNGHADPMQMALTHYYGGNVNSHYNKVCRAIGRFKLYLLTI